MATPDCVEKHSCENRSDLDVVIYRDGTPKSLLGQKVAQIRSTEPGRLLSFDFDVAFIVVQEHAGFQCQTCQDELIQAFQIPDCWWTGYRMSSHGYFGCEDAVDEQGVVSGIITEIDDQLTYHWTEVEVYTLWIASSAQAIILLFEPRPPIAQRIQVRLLERVNSEYLSSPFWMYSSILEEVIHLEDQAVWAIRNMVRATEQSRAIGDNPQPDYSRMHDMARHAIHSYESLDTSCVNCEAIMDHHNRVTRSLPSCAEMSSTSVHAWVHNRLAFHQNLLRSLRNRSMSNKERFQNEIQLAFNVVAQYDAHVSVQIARAAKADSAAMRTVAFVTLAFLPGTFICAVFSMSFFHYDGGSNEWTVSTEFWWYWAVAVPTTIITAVSWYYLNKHLSAPQPQGNVEK
ncbi:hypothetical protein GQ53DRAFT_836061 [Thozetella sp. PMI_491]|nr:hypothetical protein GQ53DRAFT_836061 [Thozetella sp. PMI_491]